MGLPVSQSDTSQAMRNSSASETAASSREITEGSLHLAAHGLRSLALSLVPQHASEPSGSVYALAEYTRDAMSSYLKARPP
jgi:hypothetical protein